MVDDFGSTVESKYTRRNSLTIEIDEQAVRKAVKSASEEGVSDFLYGCYAGEIWDEDAVQLVVSDDYGNTPYLCVFVDAPCFAGMTLDAIAAQVESQFDEWVEGDHGD